MAGPSIDFEKPNALGGLDRLVTNLAIAVIAVIPTFLTCVVMPWRIRPMLDRDDPDGREGMLLAPGAFFILALLMAFIGSALLSTPEILNNSGSYIGPGLSVAVQTAASEGNVWKIVGIIMPIYGAVIMLGLLGFCLRPWAQQDWSLRVSLRAAFYVFGTLTAWLIMTTAVIDLVRLRSNFTNNGDAIYGVIFSPTVASIVWMYFGFFRNGGAVSKLRSAALGLSMLGLMAALIFVVNYLARL